MTISHQRSCVLLNNIIYKATAYGLRTPNEGINQRYLKLLANLAEKNMLRRYLETAVPINLGLLSYALVARHKIATLQDTFSCLNTA